MKSKKSKVFLGFSIIFLLMLAFGTSNALAGEVTVKVVASDGTTPVSDVTIAYGSGTNHSAMYFPGTKTGSDGTLTATLATGTYSFNARYRNGNAYQMSVYCGADPVTVTFQTTNVTLIYTGLISYGGSTGDATWFGKPSMEMLAGTYKFHFRGLARYDLTISGSNFYHNANPATKILVETAADGSGSVVPGQDLVSNSSITVYAITRDASNQFVANEAAEWSLVNKTGNVVDEDLDVSDDNKGATFTGNAVGSCQIEATSGVLPSTKSGIINVTSACTQPSITTQPTGSTLCEGDPHTFSVEAAGTGLRYEWYKDGNLISDETNSTYKITSVSDADNGNYFVKVIGDCGEVQSSTVSFIVNKSPITDNNYPEDAVIIVGNNAVFAAIIDGTPHIQWQVSTNSGGSWEDILNENSETLEITGISREHNGNLYRAVFTIESCSFYSREASLTAKISVTDLGPVEISVGSPFNSNNGHKIDLKVEFFKNENKILEGNIFNQQIVGNPKNNLSKIYTIPLPQLNGVEFGLDDYLYCKVSVKSSGSAINFPIRMWYNGSPTSNQSNKAWSRIYKVTIGGNTLNYYYFRQGEGTDLQLDVNSGSSAQFIEVDATNDYQAFGTWRILGSMMKQSDNEESVGEMNIPKKSTLLSNYPNPFNPSTEIRFNISEDSYVKISVYDFLGRRVATLVDGVLSAGLHQRMWEAQDETGRMLSSGVFFLRMDAQSLSGKHNIISVKKIMLMK